MENTSLTTTEDRTAVSPDTSRSQPETHSRPDMEVISEAAEQRVKDRFETSPEERSGPSRNMYFD
jgi:hypothetical protein